MKKLSFYGLEIVVVGEKAIVHKFDYKDELTDFIEISPDFHSALKATSGLVRRVLRRMAADKTLQFPVEVD